MKPYLITKSGQRIHPDDPNYKTFEADGAMEEQKTTPAPAPTPTPTEPDLKNLSTVPLGDSGVNHLFKMYYKRDARPEELMYWREKSDADLRPRLIKFQEYGRRDATPATDTGAGTTEEESKLMEQMGQAGLTVDQMSAIIEKTSALGEADIQKIYEDLGIPDLINTVFAHPTRNTMQMYNQLYGQSRLGELKQKITEKIDQLNEKKETLNKKIGEIGDNPWLTEASRIGRTKRLQELAGMDIDNLEDEVEALQDLYDDSIAEINEQMQRETQDFTTNQLINTAKLNYLLKQAERKTGTVSDEKIKEAFNALPDYLKQMTGYEAQKVFGGATTGYYAWNPESGAYEQIVAPAPKSAGTGLSGLPNSYKEWTLAGKPDTYAKWVKDNGKGKPTESELLRIDVAEMTEKLEAVKGEDGFVSPDDYKTAKKAWVKQAQRKPKVFDEQFSIYRNPENPYYEEEF